MDQPLGIMGTPGMDLFALIIIGGFAGWIAGKVTGARRGLLMNIVIGILGSWLGSTLANYANVAVVGTIGHFIAALVGAILILTVWSAIAGRRNPG